MIDITDKEIVYRQAEAQGEVLLDRNTIQMIKDGKVPKGDVLTVSKTAGIMAAKNTPGILPMCHPISITGIKMDCKLREKKVIVNCIVKGTDKTGVEMEALTAVSVCALSIYDMCKGIDKNIRIANIFLVNKIKEKI